MSIASLIIKSFEEVNVSFESSRGKEQELIDLYIKNKSAVDSILYTSYEFPYISILLNADAQYKTGKILGMQNIVPGCVGGVTKFFEAIGFIVTSIGGQRDLRLEPREATSVDF